VREEGCIPAIRWQDGWKRLVRSCGKCCNVTYALGGQMLLLECVVLVLDDRRPSLGLLGLGAAYVVCSVPGAVVIYSPLCAVPALPVNGGGAGKHSGSPTFPAPEGRLGISGARAPPTRGASSTALMRYDCLDASQALKIVGPALTPVEQAVGKP
jgi:hypothetical protein